MSNDAMTTLMIYGFVASFIGGSIMYSLFSIANSLREMAPWLKEIAIRLPQDKREEEEL